MGLAAVVKGNLGLYWTQTTRIDAEMAHIRTQRNAQNVGGWRWSDQDDESEFM